MSDAQYGPFASRQTPSGIDEHGTGIGFFNRPPPDELGNQIVLVQSQLEQDRSTIDALLANFSLSGLAYTRFQGPLWKTLAFFVFIWDPITLPQLRTVAKRFTHISWHYCSICRHFRMAGPRRLNNPTVGPFQVAPSGFAHFVSANDVAPVAELNTAAHNSNTLPPQVLLCRMYTGFPHPGALIAINMYWGTHVSFMNTNTHAQAHGATISILVATNISNIGHLLHDGLCPHSIARTINQPPRCPSPQCRSCCHGRLLAMQKAPPGWPRLHAG
jgi:hypothetical protein